MTLHIGGLLCQQVSGFIYELDRRPVCRRGYSVGARTAPRFPKPSHVSSTSLIPITKCLMCRLTFVGWYNHYDKPDRFLQRAMQGLIYYQQLFGINSYLVKFTDWTFPQICNCIYFVLHELSAIGTSLNFQEKLTKLFTVYVPRVWMYYQRKRNGNSLFWVTLLSRLHF